MRHRHLLGLVIVLGAALLIVSGIALITAQPAAAQCGSQASSCKNCHETQAQLPVNADGTGWHESHAFGDFCYLCHGGNNQSMDEAEAHAAMVAPMSDVQTACAQCHPDDLQARSDVYTVALGIPAASIGAPASDASPAAADASASPGSAAPQAEPPPPVAAAPALSPNDPDLVDYVERYNREVLNQHPTNWGNVILIVLLVMLLCVGVFFVNRREGWISLTVGERKELDKAMPADVVDIAERVAKLKVGTRRSLTHLLDKPGVAAEMLAAWDGLPTDSESGDKQ